MCLHLPITVILISKIDKLIKKTVNYIYCHFVLQNHYIDLENLKYNHRNQFCNVLRILLFYNFRIHININSSCLTITKEKQKVIEY